MSGKASNKTGIPQEQLEVLRAIDGKSAKIIAILKGDALPDDPDATLLQQMLAAQNETNRLLAILVSNQSEKPATDLGGTYTEVPNPSKP